MRILCGHALGQRGDFEEILGEIVDFCGEQLLPLDPMAVAVALRVLVGSSGKTEAELRGDMPEALDTLLFVPASKSSWPLPAEVHSSHELPWPPACTCAFTVLCAQ